MKNNALPRNLAYKVLCDNDIVNLTLDNLIYVIDSYGYEIIDFDVNESNESILRLIRETGLCEMVKVSKAFSYSNNDVKFVFVSDSLSAEEKRCALAHELGHIVLNHLNNGCCSSDITEEYQANEFAHYLLHPGIAIICCQWIRRNKKVAIITLIAAIVVFGSIFAVRQINIHKSGYGNYYITESGEKYHDKNCIFIKGKKNVHRMTEKEYKSGDYEPCQICLP